MSEDSEALPGSAKWEPAENGPGSPLPMEKKMNVGQDQHPGPAWMEAEAGRGAAQPSSIPWRWEPAMNTAYMFSCE